MTTTTTENSAGGRGLARSTEIVRQSPTIQEMGTLAKAFSESGLFGRAGAAEAFVKIQAGSEMGIAPFQAMSGIHVIDGKPEVGAGLLAALVDQHPRFDYDVAYPTPDECVVTIKRDGKVRGSASFTKAEAVQAGLAGKSNWKNYLSDMLFARAMSRAVRRFCPGVTGGPVYVTGEISDSTPESEPATVGTPVVTPNNGAAQETAPAAEPKTDSWDDVLSALVNEAKTHGFDGAKAREIVASVTGRKSFRSIAKGDIGTLQKVQHAFRTAVDGSADEPAEVVPESELDYGAES